MATLIQASGLIDAHAVLQTRTNDRLFESLQDGLRISIPLAPRAEGADEYMTFILTHEDDYRRVRRGTQVSGLAAITRML